MNKIAILASLLASSNAFINTGLYNKANEAQKAEAEPVESSITCTPEELEDPPH